MAVARSLLAGRGFADPFGFPTGPTAVYAPLHPLLLAAILRIFGDSPAAAIPALLVEATIHVACLVLLVRISAAVFASWVPGLLAAAAVLACTRPSPQWENGMAALAAEVFFLCLLTRGAATVGIIAGLGWLISPSLILLSLPAAFFLRSGRYAARMAVVALFATAPWLVRNALAFQTPVFLRDNFGLELFISNNDLAGPGQRDALHRYRLLHPNENAAAARELIRSGEPRYFSQLQSEAFQWIRHHPRRFLVLTVERIGLWWAYNWFVTIVSVFGVTGLWIFRGAPLGRAASSAVFSFPLPYYVIQFDPRYAYPVLWLLALFAGFSMWRLRLWALDFRDRGSLNGTSTAVPVGSPK